MSEKDTHNARPARSYVPLGGLGTGYFELGKDAWFRNITVNNNRRPGEELALAPHCWLAVRAKAEESAPQVRLLRNTKDEALRQPHELTGEQLHWRGLYPTVDYSMADDSFPLRVTWSLFAPVIPFDHDASTMPALFISVRVQNSSEAEVDTSVVLNWQDLVSTADALEPPRPIQLEREEHVPLVIPDRKPNLAKIGKPTPEEKKPQPRPLARFNGCILGAQGIAEHCVVVSPYVPGDATVLAWDPEDERDANEFWGELTNTGHLVRAVSYAERKTAAAVCTSLRLPPRAQQRLDFIVTWHCPRFVVNGHDLGVGYANRFANAFEVAKVAVKHIEYYYRSVVAWQTALRNSTLPKWFSSMLVSSCSVFTTNAIHTRDGRLLLLESPETFRVAPHEHRIYYSLATLLFFQRFEESELAHFVEATDPEDRTRLSRGVDLENCLAPEFDFDGSQQPLLAAQMLLSAYRNFYLSGNLARLQILFPRLQEIVQFLVRPPARALPELPEHQTFDGIFVKGVDAYTAGLWTAALAAYARIARYMRQPDEAAKMEHLAKRASVEFERLLWDDFHGYYHLAHERQGEDEPPAHTACHMAQLAGQWYADLLGLGSLFDRAHILRALETIEKFNERTNGLLNAVMPDDTKVRNAEDQPKAEAHYAWPSLQFGPYVALQIHRGHVERGMRALEKYHRNVQYKRALAYDAPEKWSLRRNAPVGHSRTIHVLSLWHVLYALQGIELNVPEKRLRVMPQLPPGLHSCEWPLFLPSCLGQMKYLEERAPHYCQRLRINFDSPVSLDSILLRIPAEVENIAVQCEMTSGKIPVTFDLQTVERSQHLHIKPQRALTGITAISVSVTTLTSSGRQSLRA